MTSVQIERIQAILTEEQLQLFFNLSKLRNWLGELYLECILSQKDIEYIYRNEIDICNKKERDLHQKSPYLMR